MIWTVPTDLGPIVVREQLEPEDEPGILRLFAACDDWFESVTGGPSGPGDVQSLFYSLPEGADFDDKRLFTVRDGDTIVGLIDAVLRHPHTRACAVGMFLLAPSHRRRGVASSISRVLIDEARATGLEEITATAGDGWRPGQEFLLSIGFTLGDVTAPAGSRAVTSAEPAVRRASLALTP